MAINWLQRNGKWGKLIYQAAGHTQAIKLQSKDRNIRFRAKRL